MNPSNNLIEHNIKSLQPNYTAAEIPHINNLNNNSVQQNGLEPEKTVNIMILLLQRGITVDDFRNHITLFSSLCTNSDFSITDDNINHIFNEINMAKNS